MPTKDEELTLKRARITTDATGTTPTAEDLDRRIAQIEAATAGRTSAPVAEHLAKLRALKASLTP